MRTSKLLACAAICAALSIAAASASAQTYTKQQLQETYTTFLASEGYRPDLTNNGNVRFRREGRTYAIMVDERDPTYFSLVLSFSVDDKSASARQKRLEAVNEATANTKVVKAYIDGDGDPIFSAELFLVVPGDFKTTLTRVLRGVDSAYDKYNKKLASLN
jgi:hypothetical protein